MAGRIGEETGKEVKSRMMRGVRPIGQGTLAIAVIVTLVIGVMGGTAAGYLLGQGRGPTGGTPDQTGEVTFRLTARQIPGFVGIGGSIDGVVNPDLQVTAGTQVTIIIVGGELNVHDLLVEDFGARTPLVHSAGEEASVTFVADHTSTGVYYCTVPGHRVTMEGRFLVTGGSGGNGGGPPIGPPADIDPFHVISRHPTNLPPPLTRSTPAAVDLFLEAREVTSWIEATKATFDYWTYNGTVPGPFFRVMVNDTVTVHFRNHEDNGQNHSVDFHAVNGPGR